MRAPPRPHTHHRTACTLPTVTPTLLWCAHVVSRTVCAYRARSYGLMRLATFGTGDLTRLSNEMRAAGQLRGERTLQESREHATVAYQIGERLRAAPQTAIRVELWIFLNAIGRMEPLRRTITITGLECSSASAFAAGELKRYVLNDLWHITNQGVGRTAAEVLDEQVRAARAPLYRPLRLAPCIAMCKRTRRLTDCRAVSVCTAAYGPRWHVRLLLRDDHGVPLRAAHWRGVAVQLAAGRASPRAGCTASAAVASAVAAAPCAAVARGCRRGSRARHASSRAAGASGA